MRRFAVTEPGAAVHTLEVEDPPLGPMEVDVAVTHCGICATDIAMIDDAYGISRFPVVAGHEAVGVVTAVGAAVDPAHLPVGQRVGVGAIAGSCGRCEWCLSGRQHVCPERDDTVLRGDRGAFATQVRAGDWRHVQPIPGELSSAGAAPLLCAGTTVFSPLLHYGVRPTDRVAVVGVGGLGHLAVKFLAAWGCHVTAISARPGKEDDARRFGAHETVVAGAESLARMAGAFDFVLSTVPVQLPWDSYLATLRPQGTLCLAGVPHGEVSIGPVGLISGERRVVGGVVGSPGDTRQMLDFAARHGITAEAEVFPVARMDEALERVRNGSPRYRVVLEM